MTLFSAFCHCDFSFRSSHFLHIAASINHDAISVAVMVLAFVLASALIILEFDGSWRPSPLDPIPGFRCQTASSTTATAAASSALFRSDVNVDDNGKSARLFAIGAKSLSDTRTSADAEYKGLLMGLDQLEIALSSYDDDVLGEHHDIELIVRGDCKAVIDQLNSRSNPRKTEKYYEQAVEKINSMRHSSSVTTVAFEHVPRESNTLCDTLCKLVLNIDQQRVVASVQDMICSGEEESLSKDEQNGIAIKNMRKRSIKKKLIRPKSKHYEVAMEEIHKSSRICQSSKLALACLLSRSAIRTNDTAILLQLSDFFLQTSRKFTKIYWGDSSSTTTASKETLQTVSILCELLAMQFIDAEDEVQQLRTKHNIMSEDGGMQVKLDSILEFCTNANEIQDVLLPYSNVVTSDIIDGEKYSQELIEWNRLASGMTDLQSGVWLSINS